MWLNLDKIKRIELKSLKYNCQCKKDYEISRKKSIGKPIPYLINNKKNYTQFKEHKINSIRSKTFTIKQNKTLPLITKFLLNSFKNKYLYYVIDDILYLFKFNPIEQKNLLMILYSPAIFLQNNFSINFFDIWIKDIYINEIKTKNRFLNKDFTTFSYITVELFYKLPTQTKIQELLW